MPTEGTSAHPETWGYDLLALTLVMRVRLEAEPFWRMEKELERESKLHGTVRFPGLLFGSVEDLPTR